MATLARAERAGEETGGGASGLGDGVCSGVGLGVGDWVEELIVDLGSGSGESSPLNKLPIKKTTTTTPIRRFELLADFKLQCLDYAI
jgi:hypothetical protein